MHLTYGLLCAADGCPMAVEVFAGNAGDPSMVAGQVDTVRKRFGIERVALVGGRGMLTTARIRKDLEPAGARLDLGLEDSGHPQAAEGRRLALLFENDDREGARAQRSSPMEKAEVSESARAKAETRRSPDGLPVHSFTTLLSDLATLTLNEVTLPGSPDHAFPLMAKPTELRSSAFELLDIDPAKDVAM